jgi:hypothetical protein
MPVPVAPQVTVCVFVSDRAESMAKLRASVEAQTFKAFELLLLCNGADAATRAQVWADQDARVRIVSREESVQTPFQNFGWGIESAKSALITFMHEGEMYLPAYVEVLRNMLLKHLSSGFAGANYGFLTPSGHVENVSLAITKSEMWEGTRFIGEALSQGRTVMPFRGLMFRREVFDKNAFGAEDEPQMSNLVRLARIAEKWSVAAIAEPIMHVRKSQTQATLATLERDEPSSIDTASLLAYCEDYVARHRHQATEVARWRRSIEIRHRTLKLRDWVSSEQPSDASARLDELGTTKVDRALQVAFNGLGRFGGRAAIKKLLAR